jgi:hypothetical protein
MKDIGHRLVILIVTLAVAIGILATAAPSFAGREGRKNTARALTGVAAYQLLKGHTPEGLLFGAGAAYAWNNVNNDRDWHHHRHFRHYRHHSD